MKIEVCVGTTCHLMGSSTLIEALNDLPKDIKESLDLKYNLCFNTCYGKMKPPIVKIDNEFYQDMTPEKLKDIILNLVKNKK
ncbi:NAD(P)H-dependent oxidoreductase subunit E [Thermosipho sp. 1244]|uniref:NAD(P)H-dependent oxidoreductase subunit E n=1 Tax=Thermosipho sp. 1244 TaxID=1755816 RepID=UPI001BDE2723|nr:NAD(P)H-dependent oxidoreductase subunit E [Thermosipho sp. 1244]MBT1248280.1 hypothetical protein [Thermosipho sp. 1244]